MTKERNYEEIRKLFIDSLYKEPSKDADIKIRKEIQKSMRKIEEIKAKK